MSITPDTREYAAAITDHILGQALFKMVQIEPNNVYTVPTKRLIALIILFGHAGFSKHVMIEATQALIEHRVLEANGLFTPFIIRCPYEIPRSMLVSICPAPGNDVISCWLDLIGLKLLDLYEDEDLQQQGAAQADMPSEEYHERIYSGLIERFEIIDRWYTDLDAIRREGVPRYQLHMQAICRLAQRQGAYPALLLQDSSLAWVEKHNAALLPYAILEQRLLQELPDRLVSFTELARLKTHPAVEQLQTSLRQAGADVATGAIDETLREVLRAFERLGVSYLETMLAEDALKQLGATSKSYPQLIPSDTAVSYFAEQPGYLTQRVNFTLNYAEDQQTLPELAHIFGNELWADGWDEGYYERIKNRPLSNTPTPRTYRPL